MSKTPATPPPGLEPGALSGPLGRWMRRPLPPWSAPAFVVFILLVLVTVASALHTASPAAAQTFLIAADAVLKLFLTLFNASIFTSLYGFFVERRDF